MTTAPHPSPPTPRYRARFIGRTQNIYQWELTDTHTGKIRSTWTYRINDYWKGGPPHGATHYLDQIGSEQTPGQIAFNAWNEQLNRYHGTDLGLCEWEETTAGAKSGWEAAAETIRQRYGAIY